jgi:hypothetical protein
MKIMTLTSYGTQFSLHKTKAGFEWRLDKTPDNLAEPNKTLLYLFNRYYLPNFSPSQITPYGSLMKSIEKDFKYLDPKLKLLVSEREHGKGVPKGAII